MIERFKALGFDETMFTENLKNELHKQLNGFLSDQIQDTLTKGLKSNMNEEVKRIFSFSNQLSKGEINDSMNKKLMT